MRGRVAGCDMKQARGYPDEVTTRARTPAGYSRRAHYRIYLIHEMLRGRRFPNCQTMAREIEVRDRKTIQRDINYMRDEMNLPIEYDAVRHGYYYSGPVPEIPLLHLSRKDLLALFLARKAMEPLRGTRLERELAESFEKIAGACPGEVTFQWAELDEAFSMKALGVAEADLALFGDLVDAVRERREVTFDYRKLESERSEARRLWPHHVRQIENGWYVAGYDCDRGAMRTFALPRMSGLRVLKRQFKRDEGFDAEDYFGGGFGVWSYGESKGRRHEVRIRFEGYAARVVAERRWHASQEVVPLDEAGVIELRLKLAGLEEVMRWVLSWGSKARVLAPRELQQRVAAEAAKVAAMSDDGGLTGG